MELYINPTQVSGRLTRTAEFVLPTKVHPLLSDRIVAEGFQMWVFWFEQHRP